MADIFLTNCAVSNTGKKFGETIEEYIVKLKHH